MEEGRIKLELLKTTGLRSFIIARGIKSYDGIFAIGCLFFVIIYFLKNSLAAASAVAAFFWAISIAQFVSNYYELGDKEYSRKIKKTNLNLFDRIVNIFIFISLFIVGSFGAFTGAYLLGALLSFSMFTSYIGMGIGVALGVALSLNLFHFLILGRLFSRKQ